MKSRQATLGTTRAGEEAQKCSSPGRSRGGSATWMRPNSGGEAPARTSRQRALAKAQASSPSQSPGQHPIRAAPKRFRSPITPSTRNDAPSGHSSSHIVSLQTLGMAKKPKTGPLHRTNSPGAPRNTRDKSPCRPGLRSPLRKTSPGSSNRPGTPESIRRADHHLGAPTCGSSPGEPSTAGTPIASPISLAKRRAAVPQLYMNAGNTPPPSQVFRTKKRIQKRILVLAGSNPCKELQRSPEDEPESWAGCVPVLLDDGQGIDAEEKELIDAFKLKSPPTLEEMSAPEASTLYAANQKSISSLIAPADVTSCRDDDPSMEEDVEMSTILEGSDPDFPNPASEDIEFLLARHRPVSEAYKLVLEGISEDKRLKRRLSFDAIKEDIKSSLQMPIGNEASIVGEMLSRETADPQTDSSSSPPTVRGRVSAPAFSRSPLSAWTHEHTGRRASEGSTPNASHHSDLDPWIAKDETDDLTSNIVHDDQENAPIPSNTMAHSSSSAIKKLPNALTPYGAVAKDIHAPDVPLATTDDAARGTNGEKSCVSSPSSSFSPFDPDLIPEEPDGLINAERKASIEAAVTESRTLDEPENCHYTSKVPRKPSRRRSISEPRGGPRSVSSGLKRLLTHQSFFTLNPSVFEDRKVWGVAEFEKLCAMLNIDTSRCREFNDYVCLLHEWNLKPNVRLSHVPVSSTYHAGDIQLGASQPGNFHHIPVVTTKVPQLYRKVMDPMKCDFKLETCIRRPGACARFPSRDPSTRLSFSPYNHNCQFYLSPEERYQKRLCLHEIASMTRISNNAEGVDPQIILLDPTRELNGDPDWECAKQNMNLNLIVTNPRFHLDKSSESSQPVNSDFDRSLKVSEIANSQEDWLCGDARSDGISTMMDDTW